MKIQRIVLFIFLILIGGVLHSQAQQQNNRVSAPQRVQNWLTQMDKDNSDSIELSEATGQMKRNFQRIDSNNDESLNKQELRALAARLVEQSRNQQNRNNSQQRNSQSAMSDEQIQQRAPEGVVVELDIPYRKGNDAWKLDLAMPKEKSKTPRPAIVFVHGGGWRNGDKRAAAFLNPTLEYAAKGYVCITVNYRLGGSKLACVEDVKCSVRWLRAHAEKYNVDPDRIGAYGNSAGAHLVTMLGISYNNKTLEGDGPWQAYSSRVQAVAASATPTSPSLRKEADFSDDLIMPMSYIKKDAPPFLLFHEESDRTVPVSNSDDFVKAMKEIGAKDITYKRYTDGSGHGVFRANIDETDPLMEAFFKRTLGVK